MSDQPSDRPPLLPAGDPSEDRPRPIRTRTLDDVASLAGSALGSLSLVWVLYARVLPLTGTLGFLVCWYVAFVALYAGVTALSSGPPLGPLVLDRVVATVVHAGAALVWLVLVTPIGFVFVRGWPV